MNKQLSKFGIILKQETLSSAQLSFRPKNLILHSNDPFPGFYCSEEVPADNSCKEFSYYIPFKESFIENEELLCRISQEIQAEYRANICPAVFNMGKDFVRAFRVKDIDAEKLIDIIDFLKNKELTLFKNEPVKSFLSRIRLKAFFDIKEIGNGIFVNTVSDGLHYLEISEAIDWDDFERLITYQKLNSQFKNFDAAIGFWIEKPVFKDFIRVYGKNLDEKILSGIRKEFIENLVRHKKQSVII